MNGMNEKNGKVMGMSRAIDVDELSVKVLGASYWDNRDEDVIWNLVQDAPTIDAVPVVRCKDCQHRGDDVHCPMCFEEEIEWDDDGYTEVDWILHDRTTDDGFCDRGERREGE